MHTVTSGTSQRRSTRKLLVLLVCGLLLAAVFLGLGVFQIKRLAWKQDLLARVDRNVHALPTTPPAYPGWAKADLKSLEYRRVRLQGRWAHEHEVLVKASTVLGSGHWVLTPLQQPDHTWVWVNRGFVPPGMKARSSRTAGEPPAGAEVSVEGLLRLDESGGSWLQSNAPAEDRWYSRDVRAMTAARGLPDPMVAPYFVDAVAASAPAATPTWPRAGLTVLHFNNNHLVYALTWFSLAVMTLGGLGYLVVDERRLRRIETGRLPHDEHPPR